MAINRNITTAKQVMWNGQEAARVRGLSANDLATVLQREGSGLKTVLDALDNVDLEGVDTQDTNAVSGKLLAAGPQIVVELSRSLPLFLATLIVVAADGDDDDIEHVANDWPVALQFLALSEIASLTFSGAEGFRAFVGNAFALVGLAKTLTGADKNTGTAGRTLSENGATPSSS